MIATRKCYAYLKKSKKYILLDEEDGTFENLSDTDMIIPENVMQDREKQRLVRDCERTRYTGECGKDEFIPCQTKDQRWSA